MRCYDFYDSPHGRMLLVASGEGLTGVYFDGQKYHASIEPGWREDPRHAILRQAGRELAEYFAGERKRFETPLAPEGTPFQRAVWRAISSVDFGRTITVWRAGDTGRISRQLARRRRGHRPQSTHHHRSLPPHRRLGREPDRIRRRPGKKARAAGARRSVRRVADSRPAGYLASEAVRAEGRKRGPNVVWLGMRPGLGLRNGGAGRGAEPLHRICLHLPGQAAAPAPSCGHRVAAAPRWRAPADMVAPRTCSDRFRGRTRLVTLRSCCRVGPGNGPPYRKRLPQSRVEVIEDRVRLHSQGVEELAEEAAGRRRRGHIEDFLVLVAVGPEQLYVRPP